MSHSNKNIINSDNNTSSSYDFSTEDELMAFTSSHLQPFWDKRQDGKIEGQKNRQLYWVSWQDPKHDKSILVVNGRAESVYKYKEVFYDLFQQGFNIYSFDHRGQGASDRCHHEPQVGYVEDFDFYVADIKTVVEFFKLDPQANNYILAHSMGSAISTQYLQNTPSHPFKAIATFAPMYGINIPKVLQPLAQSLVNWLSREGKPINYAPSQRNYRILDFNLNRVTHCETRYHWYHQIYKQFPELRVAGVSSHWARQAFKGIGQCFAQAENLNIPLLVLQAEKDTIVCNKGQQSFVDKINQVHPNLAKCQIIKGARHEILFEKDSIRQPALKQALDFMLSVD